MSLRKVLFRRSTNLISPGDVSPHNVSYFVVVEAGAFFVVAHIAGSILIGPLLVKVLVYVPTCATKGMNVSQIGELRLSVFDVSDDEIIPFAQALMHETFRLPAIPSKSLSIEIGNMLSISRVASPFLT
jgi:hypothetical protein